MEASESVLRAGYRLDRYELLCPIASGGMATVWLARLRGKRGFEKLFAVKTIRTELVDDARFQEMFLDEARIASSIQHPNVAQIIDLGEQEDVLFIVMEWVDGDSLAKIRKLLSKREAKLPIAIVLRVLSDACAGLHAAHELKDERGQALEIVHRDVSPHNILLSTSGAVKVIDFGIAKAQNRRQGQTRTGIVKGKIQYMAPEQVNKGASVDRRADVWALGMCLHELVLGRLPYDGDDDVDVIRKLMGQEAPSIAADVPPAIARVLEHTMVLDPEARFPTAAAMQRALDGAMKELGERVSSEDVAAFLLAELPDLARRRRDAVGKAIDEARERGTPATESREEVAFAPTLVGERNARARVVDEARAIALTQRKGGLTPASSSRDSSLTPSTALEQEPLTIPKRSGALAWTLLFALLLGSGAAAAFMWPTLGGLFPSLGPSAAAPAPPASAGPAPAASPGPSRAPPSAETTATTAAATAPPPVASETASTAPSEAPAASASAPPHAQTALLPTPASEPPAPLPVLAPAPFGEGSKRTGGLAVDAASVSPAASAPALAPAAPSATDDDPNNPYNE